MGDVRELLAAHRRVLLALDDVRRAMREEHASALAEAQWWVCWRHVALLGAMLAADRGEPPASS